MVFNIFCVQEWTHAVKQMQYIYFICIARIKTSVTQQKHNSKTQKRNIKEK